MIPATPRRAHPFECHFLSQKWPSTPPLHILLRPHRSLGPLLKITAPSLPPSSSPPNLNGELGIAQRRYGLGDGGRSAQIPLSLPPHSPTHPPTSQFPSGTEKLVQFHTGGTCAAAALDRDRALTEQRREATASGESSTRDTRAGPIGGT